MAGGYSLAVDIGGTFTDVVLRGEDGRLWLDKTLTTHDNLLDGVLTGIQQVLQAAEITPETVDGLIVHATTIVTNALIERKGIKTALITTRGFRDVLLLRNEWRYDMFDLQLEFPKPVVPREFCFPVTERTLADGTIEADVDPKEIHELAKTLKQHDIGSVAVSLMNSYANPDNERVVRAALSEILPDLFISLSSDVAPQIREYLRASTTAINAYTVPITQPYLRALTTTLADHGFPNPPLIMLSNGGIAGCGTAGANPVRMIESGPAAGALAASYYAEELGIDRLMSFDMGGTTAKACLIEDRKATISGHFEVDRMYRFKAGSGLPIIVPSIDMIEIGAGGGSIARVDNLGLLKVGPQSAGSNPGPICYGRGGTEPTVTDANLVMGLLDPDNFLGGDMRLDVVAAKAQFEKLGTQLGISSLKAAEGTYLVVSEAMALAARSHATDRGIDYRDIPLFAFGGAGPLHACQVGELLGSSAVIFPPQASVLSAFGTLVSPPRLDLVRSMFARLDSLDWDTVDARLGEMHEAAIDALSEAGCKPDNIEFTIAADLRYRGQQHELTIVLPEDPRGTRDIAMMRRCFEQEYETQYKIALSDIEVEVVNWRLTATGQFERRSTKIDLQTQPGSPKSYRSVSFINGQVDVWDRNDLAEGQIIAGPALIEQRETTTFSCRIGKESLMRPDASLPQNNENIDGARLEVLWSNVISIVSEQARVLQRTAFSSIVRDAGDLAVAIFDPKGRMVAQAETGTPGHINSLAVCGAHLIRLFPPETLSPGDVLITNDPWLGAGHFFDITILTPAYRDGEIVAYFGSTIHHTDIGGYGHGAGARDVYQEGLWIPPLKLYNKNVLEPVLSAII